MPASLDPNLGLNYGWSTGESGWAAGMDANLKRLGALVGLSVKDRDLVTPPASPANGCGTSLLVRWSLRVVQWREDCRLRTTIGRA